MNGLSSNSSPSPPSSFASSAPALIVATPPLALRFPPPREELLLRPPRPRADLAPRVLFLSLRSLPFCKRLGCLSLLRFSLHSRSRLKFRHCSKLWLSKPQYEQLLFEEPTTIELSFVDFLKVIPLATLVDEVEAEVIVMILGCEARLPKFCLLINNDAKHDCADCEASS